MRRNTDRSQVESFTQSRREQSRYEPQSTVRGPSEATERPLTRVGDLYVEIMECGIKSKSEPGWGHSGSEPVPGFYLTFPVYKDLRLGRLLESYFYSISSSLFMISLLREGRRHSHIFYTTNIVPSLCV